MAKTEENQLKKTEETTEQGQIIMTINNIFLNLENKVIPDLRLQAVASKDSNEKDAASEAVNFDDQNKSEKMAMLQLDFIQDKLEALQKLVQDCNPVVAKGLKSILQPNASEKSEDWEKMKRLL